MEMILGTLVDNIQENEHDQDQIWELCEGYLDNDLRGMLLGNYLQFTNFCSTTRWLRDSWASCKNNIIILNPRLIEIIINELYG